MPTSADSQSALEEPFDGEELRSMMEELDFSEYRRLAQPDSSDATMFDVRSFSWTHLTTGEHDEKRRPMMKQESSEHVTSVILRSVFSPLTHRSPEWDVIPEKSILRWDTRGGDGVSSFGELSIRPGSSTIQGTAWTAHLVEERRGWEVAFGDLADRTSSPSLQQVGAVSLKRFQFSGTSNWSDRPFTKPSYLQNTLSVRGMGVKLRPSGRIIMAALAGTEPDDSRDLLGRIMIETHVSDQVAMRIGLTRDVHADPVSTDFSIAGQFLRSHAEVTGTFMADRIMSALFVTTFQPSKTVLWSVGGWNKHMRHAGESSDDGAAMSIRWRFMPQYACDIFLSGASETPEGGGEVQRSFRRIRFSGTSRADLAWMVDVREMKTEAVSDGDIRAVVRRDLSIRCGVPLASGLDATGKLQLASLLDSYGRRTSSAQELRIRWARERMMAAMWAAAYMTDRGVLVWSTHPGYLRWPIQTVYGGMGIDWGFSGLLWISDRLLVAGYGTMTCAAEEEGYRMSILAEFRL